jgi:DNA-binding CsgD family transcriptional regulator
LRSFLETIERADAATRLARNLRRLTPRERQILQHMLRADTAKETARQLGLGVGTTQNHRSHILEKLMARSTLDLLHLVAEASSETQNLIAKSVTEECGGSA